MREEFSFRILRKSRNSRARLGILKTPQGEVQTPAFVAVATQATVKTLSPDELKQIGVQIILGNTYHLYLRPGPEVVAKLGGLHQFMNWQGPLMTDSGGFQIFSLGLGLEQGVGKMARIFPDEELKAKSEKLRTKNQNLKLKAKSSQGKLVKITERGVEFTSHLDGSKHFFTPENSIQIQKQLGADIIFTFDECTSPLAGNAYTKKAMERTHRWAKRCLKEFEKSHQSSAVGHQAIFGIVQGGEYRDLREESARFIGGLPFFGFGIGGSLGKSKKDMHKVLESTSLLPEGSPRHLLGIGRPEDIREAVKRGIDLFDCVWPTRIARNGTFIVKEKGTLKITQSKFKKSKGPIMKNCACYCCQNFSRAYLHHLFRANEILGLRLATLHNLTFMLNLFREVRQEIKEGKL